MCACVHLFVLACVCGRVVSTCIHVGVGVWVSVGDHTPTISVCLLPFVCIYVHVHVGEPCSIVLSLFGQNFPGCCTQVATLPGSSLIFINFRKATV